MNAINAQVLQELQRKHEETELLAKKLWAEFKDIEAREAPAVRRINEARERWHTVYERLKTFDSFKALLEQE